MHPLWWLLVGPALVIVAFVVVVVMCLVIDRHLLPRDESLGIEFAVLELGINGLEVKPFAVAPRNRRAIVFLPGILASFTQPTPLLAGIYGFDVYAASYVGAGFDRDRVVEETARFIAELNERYEGVILIGISHGGMLTLPVVRWLRNNGYRPPFRVQVHDAPTGGSTFKPMPGWAEPLFPLLRPGAATNLALAWVLPLMVRAGGLPKDENISVPTEKVQQLLFGEVIGDDKYRAWVKASAAQDLSRQSFSKFWCEARDMIVDGRRGLDYDALNYVTSDGMHPASYIECAGDMNVTVLQPQAADEWERNVDSIHRVRVKAAHAAYREQLEQFTRATALWSGH